MRTKGNTTTFDHVRTWQPCESEAANMRGLLIVAVFDGEPEMWEIRPNSSVEQAFAELTEYYHRDWAGTNRVIPLCAYTPYYYAGVNCL